ncbi:MAG: PAS domain S-box protein [Syntrophobacterales bacterium]|nr:PAS domain S-box protein [Syntrophobacterales bacterium]
MTEPPATIRIAVIVDRGPCGCLPLMLPFSVAGYPLVEVEFFQAPHRGETPPARPGPRAFPEAVELGLIQETPLSALKPLSELKPEDFDLILDWQDWLERALGLPPERQGNLVTGPGTAYLGEIICQFQELRQKMELSGAILLNVTDAIVTINEEHLIIGYNYGAERMFGYRREEALGQDLSIIIPPPHKERHKEYVRRYLATRVPKVIGKHLELTAQRRDGSEFPMDISFSVAEIRGNFYFTGIIRDMTENKRMEERLLQSERLAAVGNTVSHIAHEIKNPLAIIGGFARQLAKAEALDDKGRQKLNIIVEEVARLEGMLAQMRDFVKRPPARKSLNDLEQLLDEVLDLFQDTFQEHRIVVQRQQEVQLPPLEFDRQQLHQVLVNLFKNALEAMPRGGELRVVTGVSEGQAEIRITDTGEGMPPEVLSRIFTPYFTTKEKGTGLGLAICRNIVEEHGGCLIADSAPGRGSTFTIRIPLPDQPGS